MVLACALIMGGLFGLIFGVMDVEALGAPNGPGGSVDFSSLKRVKSDEDLMMFPYI